MRNSFQFFSALFKIFFCFVEAFLIFIQIFQFLFLFKTILLNVFNRTSVFCLETIDRIQTFLVLIKSFIIKIQIINVRSQLTVKIIQKAVNLLKCGCHGIKLCIIFCHTADLTYSISDRLTSSLPGFISCQITYTL